VSLTVAEGRRLVRHQLLQCVALTLTPAAIGPAHDRPVREGLVPSRSSTPPTILQTAVPGIPRSHHALTTHGHSVAVGGIEAGATVRTSDGGKTWSRHLCGSLRDNHALAFCGRARAPGSGAQRRRWRHLEPTSSWSPSPLRTVLCLEPSRSGHVACINDSVCHQGSTSGATERGDLYRWSNESWSRLSGGLPNGLSSMRCAHLTHVDHADHVVAAIGSGDLWQSPVRGNTWSKLATSVVWVPPSHCGDTSPITSAAGLGPYVVRRWRVKRAERLR
jgi:hypothetical protein